jgi:hypothetical protein
MVEFCVRNSSSYKTRPLRPPDRSGGHPMITCRRRCRRWCRHICYDLSMKPQTAQNIEYILVFITIVLCKVLYWACVE